MPLPMRVRDGKVNYSIQSYSRFQGYKKLIKGLDSQRSVSSVSSVSSILSGDCRLSDNAHTRLLVT